MKKLLLALTTGALLAGPVALVQAANPIWLQGKTAESHSIQVYHSPSCGCCQGWIEHLEDHHFQVESSGDDRCCAD